MPQVLNLSQNIFNALMVSIVNFLHITVFAEAVDILEAMARAPPVQICELLHCRIFSRVRTPVTLILVLFVVLIEVLYDLMIAHLY